MAICDYLEIGGQHGLLGAPQKTKEGNTDNPITHKTESG